MANAVRCRWLAAVLVASTILGCGRMPPRTPTTWNEPATGMRFVHVDPGAFVMGSPADEGGRESQEAPHRVRLTREFWLGMFEVTQREWAAVMGTNPSHFSGDGTRPVEGVTWFDAKAFLAELGRRSPGNTFRLPTEAEWEYACRAGTTTPYGTGRTLGPEDANVAAVDHPAPGPPAQTVSVGRYPPNAWGVYDMAGNVWEWTEDEHCPYLNGEQADPHGRCGAPLKVIRGGSWYFGPDSARCALRYTHRPQDRGFSLGLRVVREIAGR